MSKFTDTDKYKDSDKRYDRLLATSPDSDYYDEPQDCLKEEVIKSFLHQEMDRQRKDDVNEIWKLNKDKGGYLTLPYGMADLLDSQNK